MSDSGNSERACRCGWQNFMAFLSALLLVLVSFAAYEVYQAENHPVRFFSRQIFSWLTS